MRPQIVRWQWDGYPTYHKDRINLVIHVVSGPLFLAGLAGVISGAVMMNALCAGASFATMIVAFGAQAVGHKREKEAPIPFAGPGDAVARIFLEQIVNLPRFILSGGWLAALRGR